MNPTTPQSNPMLEQLKDIHLPDPVSWWPIAWPWWLMLIIFISAIVFYIYYRNKNIWRDNAIKKLTSFDQTNDVNFALQCNRLLKQISIHKLDQSSASLSGITWLKFLDSKLKTAIFLPSLEAFAFIPDNPKITIDTVQLKSACELWIRKVQC